MMTKVFKNKKSVSCTAAKAKMAMFFALCLILLIACAKEDLKPHAQATVGPLPQDTAKMFIDHFSVSKHSLFVNATVRDTLCHSDGIFDMYSSMSYANEDGSIYDMKLTPTANIRIELTAGQKEVKSEAELKTTRISSKTVSESKTNNGLLFMYRKHQQDAFSDGSKADIYLTWSGQGYINADGDTMMTAHIEFGAVSLDSLSHARHGKRTELFDPFLQYYHYNVEYFDVATTQQQKRYNMALVPYLERAITDVAEELISSRLEGKYVGCGETLHWEGVEYVKTNKREFTNPVNIPVVVNITAPEPQEQPSNDSIFNEVSKGTFKESLFSENTNEDGATIRTKIGTQVSKNGGQENGTIIENTINFTYSHPTKYTSGWGTYEIDSLKLSFAEGGFTISSVSEDEDYHVWLTTNTVIPTIGECELDAIDELVRIKVAKEKKAIIVDSVYVVNGHGDRYIVDKTWFWSDASTTTAQFVYDGWHSVSPVNFGEKVVSNLNWNASGLKANGSSTTEDKKEFSPSTRFEVVYTTSTVVASATNAIENGVFGFNKTAPIVTFIDGDTKIVCPERKLEVIGQGAVPAANYNIVVRDGVSYKGYTYNYLANVAFDGDVEPDVTSQGLLLMIADEAGDAVYTYEYEWVGNTIIVRTIVTIPHTFADDEVYVYETRYTVSMSDLADGRVDAENTAFAVTASNSENALEPVVDGFFTIQPRERVFTYVVSNGAVERQMTNTVVDATISFNDGKGSHSWDASLAVSKDDNFGTAYDEGSYRVTPLTTTVTAVASGNGAPTLSSKGVTSIYIKNIPVQYRLRGEFVEVFKENSYFNVYAEKSVDGGETWTEMDVMKDFVAERHGKWAPNVTAQIVTSYEFTTHDTTKSWALEEPQTGRGTNKRFDVINVSHIEYFWKSLFPAPLDADNNDKRNISGTQKQWVNKLIYHNPETGEPMTYEVDARLETTTHTVKDGVYTRIVDVFCQGQVVESQPGTVVLELVQ